MLNLNCMKQLYNRTLSFFNVLESKIAFYPTLLAFFGFNFAFFMLYLENRGLSKYLIENIPQLIIDNGDTAMTILSSLISGLISMMVFSFSMVMLLLSNASSNFTPRLLPGLISDKRHQIILGIFLFTILYCIFVLFAIQPTGDEYQLPGVAVLLGILQTVVCFYSFIYFIHNISQSIQISNILQNIYQVAKDRLQELVDKQKFKEIEFPETENWKNYHSEQSGYLQNISFTNLVDICIEHDVKIHILPVKGIFVLSGIPLFRVSKEVDEKIVKLLLSNFNFSREELVADNYTLAFKQMTEIIVKAMSPGINDPGTAINGIDYLTELLALRMQKRDTSYIFRDEEAYIKINTIDFEDLLYNIMASIRTYCKHDITLVQKLLLMFYYLEKQVKHNNEYSECLRKEAENLLIDARSSIQNEVDINTITNLVKRFNLQTT